MKDTQKTMPEVKVEGRLLKLTNKFRLEEAEGGYCVCMAKDEPFWRFVVDTKTYEKIERIVNEPNTDYKIKAERINHALKSFAHKNFDCIPKTYRHSLERSIIKEWGGHRGFLNKELRRIFL